MDNLTPQEQAFAAKERALADKERALNAREEQLEAKSKSFAPKVRFWMTLIAQTLGLLLLVILGFATFPMGQENIARGLNFIRNVMICYLILSMLVVCITLAVATHRKHFSQGIVDFMLLSFVAFDIVLLLLLVCQEGGLCRSMFLPVFFLIPTAYMIVERREENFRLRRLVVLMVIAVCMVTSYWVAKQLPPQTNVLTCGDAQCLKPVEGTINLFWWPIRVTDFFALSHSGYDLAVFYASLISALVPVIQIVFIIIQNRLGDESPFA